MHYMQKIYAIFCIAGVFVLYRQVTGDRLLNSYLPASMQALAYYIDLLQYEPLSSTTVEPPFNAAEYGYGKENSSTTTTTTFRPLSSWQPPSWWSHATTTEKPRQKPTIPHKPALFAPEASINFKLPAEGYEIFHEWVSSTDGLNSLPVSLMKDIITEINYDDFNNDVESLNNFLRLYDDNYGRSTFDGDLAMDHRWSITSTAGKKRPPPTKPYVEFLLVYDLLKRDAKSSNLNKYEGYSYELLKELNELSLMSSQRQLYMLFKRMLDRGDIHRSDVVSRIQGIIKDLGNPKSATVKALRYIPAMPFLP